MANISKVNFNGNNLDVKDAYAREQILHKTADNYTADVAGDYTVNAGDIAMSSANLTMHTTADRTIDTDGNDSVHIDGASTLNVGGLRTEAFAGDKTETVTGTQTEKAGNRNTTVTGKWAVNLPGKAFDMAQVALKSDVIYTGKTVKQYGAKGDGTTDDSAAIMAMIDDVGYAFFTKGTYSCNLALTTSCALIGTSPKTTILKAADSTLSVVKVSNDSILNTFCGLSFTGGTSGLEIKESLGDVIENCNFYTNSKYGLFIDGKRNVEPQKLTHIVNCYSERNGVTGYYINNFADFSMEGCEGVSNAGSMGDATASNIYIKGCAGKIVNCHFWNYNDYSGYNRPKTTANFYNSDSEITNCHFEGGYDTNITITGSTSPVFTNCLIYNSFGSSSIWLEANNAMFVGCKLSAQAPDNVSYKPAWNAIFAGNAGSINGGLIGCYVVGKIFTNTTFKNWTINIHAMDDSANMLENVTQGCDVKIIGGLNGRVNTDDFILTGEATFNLRDVSMVWATRDVNITGVPYVGKSLPIANASTSTITVNIPVPRVGGATSFKIESGKCVLLYFTDNTCYPIGDFLP